MNFDLNNFRLKVCKDDPTVIKFENMKSKWKCANKYTIILSFKEIQLFKKSLEKWRKQDTTIKIDNNEDHWYKWLINGKQSKVSEFLSKKYVDVQSKLEKRRNNRRDTRRRCYWGLIDLSKKLKPQLEFFADEHDIKIDRKLRRNELRDYILKVLKGRKRKEENQQKNVNLDSKNKVCQVCSAEKAKSRCSGCKSAIYCNKDCQLLDWNELGHNKECRKIVRKRKRSVSLETDPQEPPSKRQKNTNGHSGKAEGTKIESLKYLEKYPKPNHQKSWYDLDFTLFDSKLARLQLRCSCRSGAQLPGCCAHGGSCIWFIYYVLFKNIQQLLKNSPRDEQILQKITDLSPYAVYAKGRKKKGTHWCICKSSDKDDEGWVECDNCMIWYHPSCSDTTMEDIKRDRYIYDIWHCKYCTNNDVWVVRNS